MITQEQTGARSLEGNFSLENIPFAEGDIMKVRWDIKNYPLNLTMMVKTKDKNSNRLEVVKRSESGDSLYSLVADSKNGSFVNGLLIIKDDMREDGIKSYYPNNPETPAYDQLDKQLAEAGL